LHHHQHLLVLPEVLLLEVVPGPVLVVLLIELLHRLALAVAVAVAATPQARQTCLLSHLAYASVDQRRADVPLQWLAELVPLAMAIEALAAAAVAEEADHDDRVLRKLLAEMKLDCVQVRYALVVAAVVVEMHFVDLVHLVRRAEQ
jgi:hypothetical protein